jgi:hypothetical protein
MRFDCAQTHHELERANITVPAIDHILLKRCIEKMFAADADIQNIRRLSHVRRLKLNA